ncbi:MAG: hypothetical protein KIC49_11720 [Pseudomonas fluorescens]|nr:hypothetical protein [Pseudomonas fluorescens]
MTNQTIDGVPRAALADFIEYSVPGPYGADEKWHADKQKLRGLLDAPAYPNRLCHIDYTAHPYICGCLKGDEEAQRRYDEKFGKPAAQPQVEPVAWRVTGRGGLTVTPQYPKWAVGERGLTITPLYAEQPAPVAVVPEGYCIMPRQLTAENGAKGLLLGEFKLLVTMECPECCGLEEPSEGCFICDGEGEYGQKHTIPWDQIKFIYSKAVSGLAVKADSAKPR